VAPLSPTGEDAVLEGLRKARAEQLAKAARLTPLTPCRRIGN
jgi:hypothetical protein